MYSKHLKNKEILYAWTTSCTDEKKKVSRLDNSSVLWCSCVQHEHLIIDFEN